MLPHDAIVLAGGDARRMGGVDKLAELVDGQSLLDRVLDAAAGAGAGRIVVVGPKRETSHTAMRWVRETPAGGGPAAAIAAALPAVDAPTVLVLAADLPFAATAIPRLLAALTPAGAAGAVLVDAGGRRQHLLAAYRTDDLRTAVAGAGDLQGASARALLAGLDLVEVSAAGHEALDCDTPAELASARAFAARAASVGG